jgi:hypothetical protein
MARVSTDTGEGHSYTCEEHQTVLMAELLAILKEVCPTGPDRPEEIERVFFTDIINSLHDLHTSKGYTLTPKNENTQVQSL